MNGIMIAVIVIAAVGLVGGIVLVIASRILAVKEDRRVSEITEVLPGANCGSCGFAGCAAYAKAVVGGEAVNRCVPGGAETAKKIADIMGTDAGDTEPYKAFVACRGNLNNTNTRFEYSGIPTCSACNSVYNGNRSCPFGCLGFGDCVRVCKFGAIRIENGVAVIDKEKCTGCGACKDVCPKKIIYLYPPLREPRPTVMCANHEKGVDTRKQCKAGCIACGRCVRECEQKAITLHYNVARIDYTLCNGCGKCVQNCPVKCIEFMKDV